MNAPTSFPDALIVIALSALLGWCLHLRKSERQRRLEVIHQERLAAMDKGIPLPELPLEAAQHKAPMDPREYLVHGLVWLGLGGGAMAAFYLFPIQFNGASAWPLPLPLVMLGGGLVLFYVLASRRSR